MHLIDLSSLMLTAGDQHTGAEAQRAEGVLMACAGDPKPKQEMVSFHSSFLGRKIMGRKKKTTPQSYATSRVTETFINQAQRGERLWRPVVSYRGSRKDQSHSVFYAADQAHCSI